MTGDQNDILVRLRRGLPAAWFPDEAPILDAVQTGFAKVASFAFTWFAYVKAQSRRATASDGWLDLMAFDLFGLRFRRRRNEADASWRDRIKAEVLRPRGTRPSVIQAVEDLTGRGVYLAFEPWNPIDTGGYGRGGRMGYSCAGRYGSLALPNQMFLIPLRPPGQGIPNVQGYQTQRGDRAIGAYGRGAAEYGNMASVVGPVTDRDILGAIESVRPAGCVVWTDIESSNPERFLDVDAVLDEATLS